MTVSVSESVPIFLSDHPLNERSVLKWPLAGGGHFGRDKTMKKVCDRYYWRTITPDVRNYVKTCVACQRINPKLEKSTPTLHPIPVRSQVWHMIGIDFVGPLKETTHGNRLCTPNFVMSNVV